MGRGMQLVTGFNTAPGATLTALGMASGDSLTIRATKAPETMIRLLTCWTDSQAAGILQITSPKLHDASRGIRVGTTISDTSPLLPLEQQQRLFQTDVLTALLSGSATAGDIETACMLVQYDDISGIEARLITPAEVEKRRVHTFTTENTLSLGTTGGYSGEEAINAEADFWKANTDYALLGYLTTVECAAIGWRGSDTGNLRVGGPGNETLRHVTAEWFIRLSMLTGLPCIPVFNSNNRGSILIDGVQDENGADPLVTSIWAQLG